MRTFVVVHVSLCIDKLDLNMVALPLIHPVSAIGSRYAPLSCIAMYVWFALQQSIIFSI